MKIYYSPGACSLAAHIVLEEIGLPYERELISSMDGSTESATYLSINPKGRVPALDIGGALITEVSAITAYLGMSYPQKAMERLPNWTEHTGRMLQRPAVQAILTIEGIQGDR